MKKILLLLSLISLTVFAEGIPFKPKTDNMELGRGANGDDKELIFNIGDGATNPKLLINDILKVFNFNKGLDVTGNGIFSGNVQGVDGTFTGNGDFSGANLKVGPGTNTEQFMSFKISGEEVGFKFDPVTGEVLQKKKAGDAYKKLGTGSGSGSTGINGFGEDDNANAEDGTASWSNTGGTFIAFDNTAPNEKKVIEGEQSFRFTPSAQNDEVVGPTLNFDFTKFHGRTCELGIEYTGADDNLELHVVDANGDILNEDLPNNRKIPARTQTTGPFSVSFQCPTATAIAGDANKGNLHVEIVNVGAVAAAAIDWDLTYMGTDRNLGTSKLPNTYTASYLLAGTETSGNDFFSCTKTGTGLYQCTFAYTLNEIPVIQITNNDEGSGGVNTWTNSFDAVNVNGFLVKIRLNGTLTDRGFSATVTLKGADADRVVETYKASPVTSETENEFSAKISASGTVTSSKGDFILSSTKDGTGLFTINFKPGVFSQAPALEGCTPATSFSNSYICNPNSITNSSVQIEITTDANVNADTSFDIGLSKQGADVVKPQTKNLSLAGIVVNSHAEQSQKQVRHEGCRVNNNGTATLDPSSELCSSWITSATRGTVGEVLVTYPGVFSKLPICNVTNDSTGLFGRVCTISTMTVGQLYVKCQTTSDVSEDRDFYITCTGVK